MMTQLATGLLYVIAFFFGKSSIVLLFVVSFCATAVSGKEKVKENRKHLIQETSGGYCRGLFLREQ